MLLSVNYFYLNFISAHRNACRSCRLRRCFAAGMKIDAIQNERDSIGKRRKLDPEQNEGSLFLKELMKAETFCLELRETVIKRTDQVVYDKGKIKFEPHSQIATLNDVGSSIHQQLELTVEWAKSLNAFKWFDLDDQVSKLHNQFKLSLLQYVRKVIKLQYPCDP